MFLSQCHVQECCRHVMSRGVLVHHAMSRRVFDCVCAVFEFCCAALVVSVVLLPHGRWGRQHMTFVWIQQPCGCWISSFVEHFACGSFMHWWSVIWVCDVPLQQFSFDCCVVLFACCVVVCVVVGLCCWGCGACSLQNCQ